MVSVIAIVPLLLKVAECHARLALATMAKIAIGAGSLRDLPGLLVRRAAGLRRCSCVAQKGRSRLNRLIEFEEGA